MYGCIGGDLYYVHMICLKNKHNYISSILFREIGIITGIGIVIIIIVIGMVEDMDLRIITVVVSLLRFYQMIHFFICNCQLTEADLNFYIIIKAVMIVIMVHLLDTLVQGLDFMVIILDLLRIGAGEGVIEMKVRQGIPIVLP